LSDVKIISKGQKIGLSESNVLRMLDIQPLINTLKIIKVYEDGSIFNFSILDKIEKLFPKLFEEGLQNVNYISHCTGYLTDNYAKFILTNVYNEMLSLCCNFNFYENEQSIICKQNLFNNFNIKKKNVVIEEKKVEMEEDDESGLFGLF